MMVCDRNFYGMVIHLIVNNIRKHDINNNLTLASHFFIAGVIVHLLYEFFSINKWYCVNGNACKT